jgi:hypothetical protein
MQHPINVKRAVTAFRLSRSIAPIEGGVDGHVAQSLVQSGPASWSEHDVKGLYETSRPEKNEDKGDKAGPISLAAGGLRARRQARRLPILTDRNPNRASSSSATATLPPTAWRASAATPTCFSMR